MCRNTWFDRRVAPLVVHLACSAPGFARARRRVVSRAHGVVVEVGIGTGLNLPHYAAGRVDRIVGIDPDARALAAAARRRRDIPLDLVVADGERLGLPNDHADCVVVSYALCTIPAPEAALVEIMRVLKPGGTLLFTEHGAAARPFRQRAQRALASAWRRLAAGCHLTREPLDLIRGAGFRLEDVRTESFGPLLWPLGSHHMGAARKPAIQGDA